MHGLDLVVSITGLALAGVLAFADLLITLDELTQRTPTAPSPPLALGRPFPTREDVSAFTAARFNPIGVRILTCAHCGWQWRSPDDQMLRKVLAPCSCGSLSWNSTLVPLGS